VSFRVRLTREAEADLDRLFDFVLEREPARDGGGLSLAEQALVAIAPGSPR
jgi:plasmid stabilization system protein ParE